MKFFGFFFSWPVFFVIITIVNHHPLKRGCQKVVKRRTLNVFNWYPPIFADHGMLGSSYVFMAEAYILKELTQKKEADK